MAGPGRRTSAAPPRVRSPAARTSAGDRARHHPARRAHICGSRARAEPSRARTSAGDRARHHRAAPRTSALATAREQPSPCAHICGPTAPPQPGAGCAHICGPAASPRRLAEWSSRPAGAHRSVGSTLGLAGLPRAKRAMHIDDPRDDCVPMQGDAEQPRGNPAKGLEQPGFRRAARTRPAPRPERRMDRFHLLLLTASMPRGSDISPARPKTCSQRVAH
jgi:hypothetical protein